MRRVRAEKEFNRTQENTNPTRVRTTIASAETNEMAGDDRGGGVRLLTNCNYVTG